MTDSADYTLGDDVPKTKPEDDRLEYAQFAERIATTIANLEAPHGYVIGLHGKWGSGKSTVLNFVTEYLRRQNCATAHTRIKHIDFRPWMITGHHDLMSSFFKVLSEQLPQKSQGKFGHSRKRRRLIKSTSNTLVDAVATVGVVLDPSAGVGSRLAGKVIKSSVSDLMEYFLQEPSLQKAYDDLRKKLREDNRRFLVTIDDVDRLEHSDIRAIMRMVKSIGQLPNVVYLLSYDRDIVWSALNDGPERIGPAFGEKIIQQELELPLPSKNALLRMLDHEACFLLREVENTSSWHSLLQDGVHRWIRSPRDVVRLSNAVKFIWPVLGGEIDAQDLLCMEGLRLFDSRTFMWLRDNRDVLFRSGRFQVMEDEAMEKVMVQFQEKMPEETKREILGVVVVLFPQLAKWLNSDASFFADSFEEVKIRRGIGSEAGFDSYFSLHPSSDAVPLSVVRDLMSHLSDSDSNEAILRQYLTLKDSANRPMIGEVLDELRIRYKGNEAVEPTEALLEALFRIADEVIGTDYDWSILNLPPSAQIDFLVRNMLVQWGLSKAGMRLIEVFEKSESMAFLSEIYFVRGSELNIFEASSSEQPCINNSDFDRLGVILKAKIEAAFERNTLWMAPVYFHIIKAWSYLSTPVVVKSWLDSGISKSAEFMSKACLSLLSWSIDDDGNRHYAMREHPDSTLYDLRMIVRAGRKHLERYDLTEDQRKRIDAVVCGAKKILAVEQSESSPKG